MSLTFSRDLGRIPLSCLLAVFGRCRVETANYLDFVAYKLKKMLNRALLFLIETSCVEADLLEFMVINNVIVRGIPIDEFIDDRRLLSQAAEKSVAVFDANGKGPAGISEFVRRIWIEQRSHRNLDKVYGVFQRLTYH